MNIRAYNDYYLDDAMQSVGAMLDYAVNACGEDFSLFYNRFIVSGVANSVAKANPKYIGLSGTELAHLVARLTGGPLPEKEPLIDVGSPEYWTGWALAYVSWYLNIDYARLEQKGVSAQTLRGSYNVLHEADISKTVQIAERWLDENAQKENPLKRQRTVSGLTQQELSEASGIPLRVIRSYEQGQRSLENAGAASVLRLSRVLSCQMEDLL
ncbi:MAG: helix-turn-helix transcriptional regulator [Bacteroidales bacterium]|nr:helix-turn-helix transcriptional regulator [Bacteroidales bacterium]